MYTHILLDLDNTLLDFDTSAELSLMQTFDEFLPKWSLDYLPIYQEINLLYWKKMEAGEIPKEKLRLVRFEAFLKEVQADPSKAQDMGQHYLQQLANKTLLYAQTTHVLQHIAPHFQLALVTNGFEEVQVPRLEKAQLLPYFDQVVISDVIGHYKPASQFFDHTFEVLGAPEKKGVLMVGDSLSSDIQGGNNYDLDTCWANFTKKKNESEHIPNYEIHSIGQLLEVLEME